MYVFGIFVGAAVTIAVGWLWYRVMRKATHQEGTLPQYDERQMEARGKAYKYAYVTVMVLLGLSLFLFEFGDGAHPVIPTAILIWIIMLLGLLVFVSAAIWTNAYIGMNETFRGSIGVMVPVAIINLVFGGMDLALGVDNLSDDGFGPAVNLGIGIVLLVTVIEMIVKRLYDRQNSDPDEE